VPVKNLKTWKFLHDSLSNDIAAMLLYVVESKGSSPGRQGFMMVVNEKGNIEGSIGGGIMEHKLVELARQKLFVKTADAETAFLKKQLHDKLAAANQSGMICSGEQTIFFYRPKATDRSTVQSVINALQENKNGSLQLSPGKMVFDENDPAEKFSFLFQSEEDWLYCEQMGYTHFLHIIGAGHCSLALSSLMRQLHFYVKIYDDRQELKTFMENDSAHEKFLVTDYAELNERIAGGPDQYLVIMTMGYRTDDIALRALMGKEFAYIGMLGSRTKTGKMMDAYHAEGLSSSWLQRIHSPAGLSISSQTPEEIAVSIAAEMISTKNKQKR
jgi:xanthine dehydrogenase accessory factor